MDATRFELLKSKCSALKDKKTKADGARETLVQGWVSKLGLSTAKDVENYVVTQEADIEDSEARMDELMGELEGLTNWGLV